MSDANMRPCHTLGTDTAPEAPPWWRTEVDGHPVSFWITVGMAIAAVVLGFGAWWTYGLDQGDEMAGAMTEQRTSGESMGEPDDTPAGMRVRDLAQRAIEEAADADW